MTTFSDVTALNASFLDGLSLLTQQKTARIRQAVSVERVTGERQAFDMIGSASLVEKTQSNQPVPVTETARFRRWMQQKDYWNSERFDGFDQLRQHTDPTGRLAQSWASGAMREWDRCAVAAALDTNYVDKNGSTPVNLPESQIIKNDGEGMTLKKVQEAVRKLRRVSPDRDDPITIFLTSAQEAELLENTIISSNDYHAGKPLMDASLAYFAGAYFHIVDDFLDLASPASGGAADGSTGTFDPILPYREVEDIPIRSCFATLQSGLIMGELMPITTEINPAKEYGIHAQQLQVEMSVGGARAHESKVVRIDCLDTSDMSFG